MDDRTKFIIAQALAVAIEALGRLPKEYRPDSNITDMKALLDDWSSPQAMAFYQEDAKKHVDRLLAR